MTSEEDATAFMLAFDIDAPCGRHFRYRDLIECGETWHRLAALGSAVANIPQEPETISAMRSICGTILDPAVDRFGQVELTYAFASAALAARIAGRIAPSLDQHGGSDLGRSGAVICDRRGMAVDFHVPGTSSAEVARWICSATRFDRLYFYGVGRPIHVSIGPEGKREVVKMRKTGSGRTVPRVVSIDDFIENPHR